MWNIYGSGMPQITEIGKVIVFCARERIRIMQNLNTSLHNIYLLIINSLRCKYDVWNVQLKHEEGQRRVEYNQNLVVVWPTVIW